ncbi:RDD family protein [Daejeonella sp.]|uniref:RDD family protein n=1 Tax=Daejeonella sp. TaxID=2805397 RepID=UPI0025BA14B9|nr:RDD family protein [Daejeonella sp.]
MKRYIVVINGKPSAPYVLEDLKTLNIKAGTFVKTEEMDDYKEVHEIPELCNYLGLKHQKTLPQYFAGLDVRLLAVIIDYFIIFAIYCVIALIIVLFLEERELKIKVSLAGLAIIPIVKLVYSIIMEASARQGTWGKVLMGLRICDEQGNPISFARALARNLSKIISTGTLGLGYLMGFFNKKQQCLHDLIAGTLVVKDRLI